MDRHSGEPNQGRLIVTYDALGTISVDEMLHALVADFKALRDLYNVQYVKGSMLRLTVTNEYGEEVAVRRPAGGTIRVMDTHHYRPACKDYDL